MKSLSNMPKISFRVAFNATSKSWLTKVVRSVIIFHIDEETRMLLKCLHLEAAASPVCGLSIHLHVLALWLHRIGITLPGLHADSLCFPRMNFAFYMMAHLHPAFFLSTACARSFTCDVSTLSSQGRMSALSGSLYCVSSLRISSA